MPLQIVRPVLGVTIAPPQTLRQLGLEGVLVLEVPQGTPAAKAGLQGTFRWAALHATPKKAAVGKSAEEPAPLCKTCFGAQPKQAEPHLQPQGSVNGICCS